MYILYSMPPKLYNKYTGGKYESYDEMIKMRKQRDNHKNFINIIINIILIGCSRKRHITYYVFLEAY